MSTRSDFEWDSEKDKQNEGKHGISFALAQIAFLDPDRVILEDLEHSVSGGVKMYQKRRFKNAVY